MNFWILFKTSSNDEIVRIIVQIKEDIKEDIKKKKSSDKTNNKISAISQISAKLSSSEFSISLSFCETTFLNFFYRKLINLN